MGNVNFIYQGNLMFCDSAHYFDKIQSVKAYGKVHINKHDTLNFYCDSLYFDGKKEKYFLKRFLIENENKEETFISLNKNSFLEIVSTDCPSTISSISKLLMSFRP